jgi:hypothetical protein
MSSLSDPSPADKPDLADGTVAQGSFTGVDTFLTGSGEARIVRTEDGKHALLLSELSLPDLPDLHLALVAADGVSSDDDFLTADQVDLGPVGTMAGEQQFAIPDGVEISGYPTVAIWSRPFGILVARANLAQ